MALKNQREFYYTNIAWRHTSLRPTAFGLDPLVLLVIPLSFITLAREWPMWFFIIYGLFVGAICYAKWQKFQSFAEWCASLRTRAQGVQWPVR